MTGWADCICVKPGMTMPAQAERLVRQGQLQLAKLIVDLVDGVADPEPEIERHLVVAGAGGVQPAAAGPDHIGQPGLDVHMDVLERAREREGAGLDLAADLVQTSGDGAGVLGAHDAGRRQHGHVRL